MNESQVTAREARAARRLLQCAGAVVILSCALAAGVQTSWGRVKVHGLKIPTQNGQWLAADLFRPRSATSDTPAPLVVVVPGFQRSKEALAAISIELSPDGNAGRDVSSTGGSTESHEFRESSLVYRVCPFS